MPTDFRLVEPSKLSAKRAMRDMRVPKGTSIAQKAGLRYENRVRKQLGIHVTAGRFCSLEHNPWFTFSDPFGSGACCPDFLLWPSENQVIIVEVKLTWVFSAVRKSVELYKPVVERALGVQSIPLIIVRNLTPDSPPASHSLREALRSNTKVLQYFDNGAMLW